MKATSVAGSVAEEVVVGVTVDAEDEAEVDVEEGSGTRIIGPSRPAAQPTSPSLSPTHSPLLPTASQCTSNPSSLTGCPNPSLRMRNTHSSKPRTRNTRNSNSPSSAKVERSHRCLSSSLHTQPSNNRNPITSRTSNRVFPNSILNLWLCCNNSNNSCSFCNTSSITNSLSSITNNPSTNSLSLSTSSNSISLPRPKPRP